MCSSYARARGENNGINAFFHRPPAYMPRTAAYAGGMTPHRLAANFVETDVDDETLIVDMAGGLLFSLSGTGQAVWKAIDGQRSAQEIAGSMAEDYEGETREISADVERLLHKFAEARLVELRR